MEPRLLRETRDALLCELHKNAGAMHSGDAATAEGSVGKIPGVDTEGIQRDLPSGKPASDEIYQHPQLQRQELGAFHLDTFASDAVGIFRV